MKAKVPQTINSKSSSGGQSIHLSGTGEFFFPDAGEDDFSCLVSSYNERDAEYGTWKLEKEDDLMIFYQNVSSYPDENLQNLMNRATEILKEVIEEKDVQIIKKHLPHIIRFARDCPFPLIKRHFSNFLKQITPDLEELNINVPKPKSSSRYFSEEAIPQIDSEDEEVAQIFKDCFIRNNRVDHLTRLLAWHPSHYRVYMDVYHVIMNNMIPWRNYLAMMAAASFKCSYIVQQQEKCYLENKGDPSWLKFENLPQKFKNLAEVNSILAHQPWRLRTYHIEKLLKGQDPWSGHDLLLAFIILATFRSISGFALAMGIQLESDFQYQCKDEVENQAPQEQKVNVDNEEILKKLKGDVGAQAFEQRRNIDSFAEVETQKPEVQNQSIKQSNGWTAELEEKFKNAYSNLEHEDFDVRSNEYKVFNVADFSWETHAFSILRRFQPAAAETLERCFSSIRSLTYGSFNDQKLDTEVFRMAIWHYVHRIYGVFHDDYIYSKINMFLNKDVKNLVKNISKTPYLINYETISNLGNLSLKPEEKAHIALLAMEARRQAELLYALRAYNDFHTRA